MAEQEDKRIPVTLSCGHMRYYKTLNTAPKKGDPSLCPECGKHVTVTSATPEYSVHCGQCVFSRSYGKDKERAEKGAHKHVAQKPTHRVSIMDGLERVATVEGAAGLLPVGLSLLGLPNDHAARLKPDYQSLPKRDPNRPE